MEMNSRELELRPSFMRSVRGGIRGMRTRHVITLVKNQGVPTNDFYVTIPKLDPASSIVPGSIHLRFNIAVTGTKSYFMNNLSKLLIGRMQIKVGSMSVYDNSGENYYRVYKDLFRSKIDRSHSVEYGIANENIRKLISGDDTGASSGDAQKVSDALMKTVFERQQISVNSILEDHGLHAPYFLNNDFEYTITFAPNSEVLVAQSGETLGSYSLSDIKMEYETIANQTVADVASRSYIEGRDYAFEHVTLMKKETWDKDVTIVNENINLPRASMKAIVFLFTQEPRTNSELFVYPNIEKVKITIEGKPNLIYSQGIPKNRFYDEAKRMFLMVRDHESEMSPQDFYRDKFALVIDLRSIEDTSRHETGKRIVNTQSGVLLEITKLATTADVICRTYVVSDAVARFANNDLSSVEY